jgi:uncharacterized OsmC-like protein
VTAIKRDDSASLRVVHRSNDRFDVIIGPFYLSVDQPTSAGGNDTAPTPTELFVASLAACQAFYAQRFLRRHAVEGDVTITASWSMAERPARVSRVQMHIDAPHLPAGLGPRLMKVVEHCTVHNTLRQPPEIVVELDGNDLSAAS